MPEASKDWNGARRHGCLAPSRDLPDLNAKTRRRSGTGNIQPMLLAASLRLCALGLSFLGPHNPDCCNPPRRRGTWRWRPQRAMRIRARERRLLGQPGDPAACCAGRARRGIAGASSQAGGARVTAAASAWQQLVVAWHGRLRLPVARRRLAPVAGVLFAFSEGTASGRGWVIISWSVHHQIALDRRDPSIARSL
jgi:hypothetical protein